MHADCDNDCLLVLAEPGRPHLPPGNRHLFRFQQSPSGPAWPSSPRSNAWSRSATATAPKDSYTTRLFEAGVKRIAQKVGEEGLETALAAVAGDREELTNEAADLLYHLLVLLRASGLNLEDVVKILESRHQPA